MSSMTTRGRLFRKYAAVLILLVGGVLLLSSLGNLYFSYHETLLARHRGIVEGHLHRSSHLPLDPRDELLDAACCRQGLLALEPDQRRLDRLPPLAP